LDDKVIDIIDARL